jgi:hypothetical protein
MLPFYKVGAVICKLDCYGLFAGVIGEWLLYTFCYVEVVMIDCYGVPK